MRNFNIVAVVAFLACALTSCSESESYSDMLRDEEHAVNWWLSQHKVETSIPADSAFITGEDAPFYKVDEDGYLYMQVISMGDLDQRAEKGDMVYFRYSRQSIKDLYELGSASIEGNSENVGGSYNGTYFVYKDTRLPSTTQYGEGIQKPLDFVGYNAEVNLVLSSYYGFVKDQTSCIPYIMNIRYFRPEY